MAHSYHQVPFFTRILIVNILILFVIGYFNNIKNIHKDQTTTTTLQETYIPIPEQQQEGVVVDIDENIREETYQQNSNSILSTINTDNNDPLLTFIHTHNTLLLSDEKKKFVILVYASFSYLEPLLNWLVALIRLKPPPPLVEIPTTTNDELFNHIVIICLDKELQTYLQQIFNIQCFLLADDSLLLDLNIEQRNKDDNRLTIQAVSNLWVIRTKQVLRILQGGYDVIISDTDAIWLQNPLPLLYTTLKESDIIGGRGFFPFNPPRGTTLCMGFVFLRSNPQVIQVVNLALKYTIQVGDDQIGFDMAFVELENNQKIWPEHKLDSRGIKTITGKFTNNNNNFSLTFVSANVIPRDCSIVSNDDNTIWKSQVIIAHCHMHNGQPAKTMKEKGNQKSHTEVLKKFNIYFLKSDWKELLDINNYYLGQSTSGNGNDHDLTRLKDMLRKIDS
jgi:hypothetical protein